MVRRGPMRQAPFTGKRLLALTPVDLADLGVGIGCRQDAEIAGPPQARGVDLRLVGELEAGGGLCVDTSGLGSRAGFRGGHGAGELESLAQRPGRGQAVIGRVGSAVTRELEYLLYRKNLLQLREGVSGCPMSELRVVRTGELRRSASKLRLQCAGSCTVPSNDPVLSER